ncbi:MAG: ankyrin repeat domain-containing protein [Verrucomicrobia subdivision 3 bacterium]|nr:ankyrin repeat domain-containing protein [Limisphaerales bacterium]
MQMLTRFKLFTPLIVATALLAGCTAVSTGIQYIIIRPFINDPKPLHQAAQSGDIAAAEELIAADANLNATAYGPAWTPLHLAARDGHLAVVKLLVAHGAKVNTKDRAGDRPLDLAAEHRDVSNFLRQHGGITKTENKNLK